MQSNSKGGYILFEDGFRLDGEVFIGRQPALGEAVFNTSHSGYQEIVTDPSYCGQIMIFTAPHIGNVGVNDQDAESDEIHPPAVVIRRLPAAFSNWRGKRELAEWLNAAEVPLLIGADTRAATRHLRTAGAKRAGVFPQDVPQSDAMAQILSSPSMVGADLASKVSCRAAYPFDPGQLDPQWHPRTETGNGLHVGVLDFGVKRNILRLLAARGCRVTVLPAATTASAILDTGYSGILISNGPGDPEAVGYAIDTITQLIGRLPLFGICLGHQLLSLAAGFETFKLKFGHRGANHPVRRESDQVVEITSQNHGFAVAGDKSIEGWRFTHINLNDHTIEGLEHEHFPHFSIQYHPEASPGPHDGLGYFDRFIQEMIAHA